MSWFGDFVPAIIIAIMGIGIIGLTWWGIYGDDYIEYKIWSKVIGKAKHFSKFYKAQFDN